MFRHASIFIVDTPLNAEAYVHFLRSRQFDAHILQPAPSHTLSLPSRACVLFEVHLPDLPCVFSWVLSLRRQSDHLCLVPWTVKPRPFFLWAAYRLGFASFLDKGKPLSELLPYFRALLEGRVSWPAELWEDVRRWDEEVAGRLEGMTMELWGMWEKMLEGKDIKEVGVEMGVSEGTVRRKRKELFEVLEVRGWAEAVRKACGWGLTVARGGEVAFHPLVDLMFRSEE